MLRAMRKVLPVLTLLLVSCGGAEPLPAKCYDKIDGVRYEVQCATGDEAAALVSVGGTCAVTADCDPGLYCEIGPGWALSAFTSLDHTCQPVATSAIAAVTTCTLPALATVTPTAITYTSDGLTCKVYQPATGTGLPVVLGLPYGGFLAQFAGNADFVNFARAIVSTGKVAVLCDYSKATSTQKGVPEELSDVRCAIRTAATSALGTAFTAAGGGTYRGSPSRLGVVGSSAGGSLALVAVLTADQTALAVPDTTAPGTYHATLVLDRGTCLVSPSADERGLVKRLVAAAPPTDMPGPYGYGAAAFPTNATKLGYYAGAAADPVRADMLTAVSPALWDMAHPYVGAPPILLTQLAGDTTVDPAQSATMDAALAAHGFAHARVLGGTFMCGPTNCSHPVPLVNGGGALSPNCTMYAFLAGL
jgi:acetyl esterase/lipase